MSDNERIVNGYTIKPGADLAFADLRECNLRECDLRGCDLTFAKLPLGLLWAGDLAH